VGQRRQHDVEKLPGHADQHDPRRQQHSSPQTLALTPASPAIGAGDPADCQANPVNNTDERNQTRNAKTRLACDTGAYDTAGH
jgi:hypothetical protein